MFTEIAFTKFAFTKIAVHSALLWQTSTLPRSPATCHGVAIRFNCAPIGSIII